MSVMHSEMDKSQDMRMEWNPFSDDQVEGLFFPGAGRGELIEQLLHMLRYGASLTLLVGPAGVGKRTLLSQLMAQLDAELFDIAAMEADESQDFAHYLALLEEPWRSLRSFTLENYLELVPAVAAAADEESKTLLLIVRHAQRLNAEVVSNLQAMLAASAGLPLKCLLLVDAAELESVPTLQVLLEALPDSTVMYLDPLTESQTQEYLQYRMHVAGMGQVSFNAQQVQRIHQRGAGNPATMNKAASELLLEAMPAPVAIQERAPFPWVHIAIVAVVAVVVAVLMLSAPEETSTNGPVASNTVVLENPIQAEPAPVETPFTEVAKVAAESGLAPEPVAPAPVEAGAATSLAPQGDAGPAVAGSEGASDQQLQPAAVNAPAQVAEPVAPVSQAPAATVIVPESKPEPAKVVPAPKPAPVAKTVPAVDTKSGWLKTLPKDHYVLQLLGAQEEATVKRFLSQYPSLRKVTYYKTWRQGKPWYVVVQGDYATYDAAKAGIGGLPGALQKQNPWIRKVDAIQQQIR